jgi:hypothetical protein
LLRLTAQPVRFAVAGLGGLMILGSLAKLIQLTVQWAGDEVFTDTRSRCSPQPLGSSASDPLGRPLHLDLQGRLTRFDEAHLHDEQRADR